MAMTGSMKAACRERWSATHPIMVGEGTSPKDVDDENVDRDSGGANVSIRGVDNRCIKRRSIQQEKECRDSDRWHHYASG